MCWACEEQDLWWRYQLELAVERGVIPEGFEPADFEAYGLPVPERREQPAASPPVRLTSTPSKPSAFVCDTPDGK
jgi:hypothetical protein